MDRVSARNEPLKPFAKASEGTHQCVLVDVIDLGYHNKEFQGKKKGFKQYCSLVWQIDEENPDTGKPFEMSREFQVTMFAKGSLRILLEQWRGRSYTDVEAEAGVPLDKLYGANGLMQVEHKQSQSNPDRTYANIMSVTPLPKAMLQMKPANYQRSDHWKDKLGISYEKAFPPPPDQPDDDDMPPLGDDDDLPF